MAFSLFKSGFAAIFAAIIMLFSNLFHVNTAPVGGNFPPADPPDDPPEIVLVIEYTNFAWGYQQDVTVITDKGNCYRKSIDQDSYDWEEIDKISIDIDDYDSLVEITKEPANMLKEIKDMNAVWNCYPKFAQWSGLPSKEYDDVQAFDYGMRSLYAFYKDGGEIKRVFIAESGDCQSCVNDKDAIALANEMLPRLPGFDFT